MPVLNFIFGLYSINMIQFKDKRLVKFGERVREVREEKGFSINDVIARGQLSRSDLNAIESGSKNFGFTTLLELCKSLEVPASELLNIDLG